MSEDRLQQEAYHLFHNTYPNLRGLLFHVPNGGARNAREGAKFKTMGVRPGVADFIFLFDGSAYMIELKTKRGKQSQDQINWEFVIRKQGFAYFIIRSLAEFQILIQNIIEICPKYSK